MKSINPASGELIESYEIHGDREVAEALTAARRAFLEWRRVPFAERARLMRRAAKNLRDSAGTLGALMAREMGKPIAQGRGEAEKCAWVCDYYADNAADFLAPRDIGTEARRSRVVFEPLGVVLAVMPWNFPMWQVFRAAAPSLMAGNAMVLKHASNVPGCALAIERVFHDSGFPPGLFKTLLVESGRVGQMIAAPEIAAVTLTGSTHAGRSVAEAAGRALKKVVLELGGSDPYVILEDADLEAAAAACSKSRLINSGQSCIAAKRFVVVEAVRQQFTELLIDRMAEARIGDPMADDTEVGPMARGDLRDELHQQVKDSVLAGAGLRLGGEIPPGPGFYYPTTVLEEVRPGMPAYDQELFGPVAAIIGAAGEADAVRIANDSSFGLGAAVFTRDLDRGEAIAAHQLEAGFCAVNDFVRSDPRLPFGGIKESGYGRELSDFGIREFVNIKTVYVA